MQITKNELHQLINELPEEEIPTASKFLRFLIDDYKKLIKPSIKEENLEKTPDKLIEKTGSCSTGGKSAEDVKEEEFDITQDPIYQMEGYDSDAPADLSVNLDKYLYGEKEEE